MGLRFSACVTLLLLAGCTSDPPTVGEIYEFVEPSGGQFLRGEVVEIGDCRRITEAEQNDGDLVGVMGQFDERSNAPCAGLLMEGMRPFAGPNGQAVGQMLWVLPLAELESGSWQRTEAGAPPLEKRSPTGSRSFLLLALLFLFILGPVLLKLLRRRRSNRRPAFEPGVSAFGAASQDGQVPLQTTFGERHQAEFAAEQRRWEQWQAERGRSGAASSSRSGDDTGSAPSSGTGWSALSPEVAEAYYLFDLEPGATEEAIRQARRKLAGRWHPDRFEGDDRMKAKATEKLKRINQAYELLMHSR